MSIKLDYRVYESPWGWYTILIPDYWENEVIEGIPAFYDPEGAGALQVSAFQNRVGDYNLEEELERYLHSHDIDYDEDKISSFMNNEGAKILACEFIAKERYWLVYIIARKDKLILCTYNADENPDKELSGILSTIISSIHFKQNEE